METPGDPASEARLKVGMIAACLLTGLAMFLFLIEDEESGTRTLEDTPSATSESGRDIGASLKHRGVPSAGEAAGSLSSEKSILDPVAKASAVDLFGRICARSSGRGIEQARIRAALLPFDEEAGFIEATADASGRFHVPVAVGEDSGITDIHLWISAEGFRDLKTTPAYARDWNVTDLGNFHLREDGEHVIVVNDGTGAALPNARLTFYRGLSHDTFVPAFTKTSDAGGRVRVKDSELDKEDKWWQVVVRAAAKGMADRWFHDLLGEPLPAEISMESAGYWTCRVIDREAEAGLPGAVVTVEDELGFLGLDSEGKRIERIRSAADASGNLKIPKTIPLHEMGTHLTVRVVAEGFIPWTTNFDLAAGEAAFPREIPLMRPSFIKTGKVVNLRTEDPIPGIPVHLHPYDPTVSDESGRFSFPLGGRRKATFLVDTRGFRRYQRTFEPGEEWLIQLTPGLTAFYREVTAVAQVRLKTRVKDELGEPVAGAKVRVLAKGEKERDDYFGCTGNAYNHGMDRLTGPDGLAVHEDRPLLANRILRMAVDCSGFAPFHAQFEVEDPDRVIERTVILQRGFPARNIKVVDRNGDPLSGKAVKAALTLEDGKTVEIRSSSGAAGFCEMVVPRFEKGRIVLPGRYGPPDDEKTITYREILACSPVTLVSKDDLSLSGRIRGVVLDGFGKPAGNAGIQWELTRASLKNFTRYPSSSGNKSGVSSEDGTFEIPVFKNQSYHLTIYLSREDGFWYLPEDHAPVFEGSEVELVLVRGSTARLDLSSLLDAGVDLDGYETWAEAEDENHLTPLVRSMKAGSCNFYFQAGGRMRIILKTRAGRRYRTPFFTLRPGESRTVAIMQ